MYQLGACPLACLPGVESQIVWLMLENEMQLPMRGLRWGGSKEQLGTAKYFIYNTISMYFYNHVFYNSEVFEVVKNSFDKELKTNAADVPEADSEEG